MSTVTVDLEVHNAYPDSVVVSHVYGAVVGSPPSLTNSAALSDWSLEQLFPHTGTGRREGDSIYAIYTVHITRSTDPKLEGLSFELG